MTEQGAVLFLNEDDGVWELVTMDADDPVRVWKTESEALRELADDGWKIEGPFRMRPKAPGLPKVRFTGHGLMRRIQ